MRSTSPDSQRSLLNSLRVLCSRQRSRCATCDPLDQAHQRRDRERLEQRRYWREREVRHGGCKTVSVRETRPDGSVVTRTKSRC